MRSPPVSRILFRQAVVIISLGPPLPETSVRWCSLGRAGPRARGAACERSCFRWGLPRDRVTANRRELLPHDFTLGCCGSTTLAATLPGMFLWHFPSSCPDRTLSCTLPSEARTFLDEPFRRDDPANFAIDGGGKVCHVGPPAMLNRHRFFGPTLALLCVIPLFQRSPKS